MPPTPGPILGQVGAVGAVGAVAVAAAAAVFQRLVAAARLLLVDHQLPRAAYHLLSVLSCYFLLLFTCLMLFCSNSWLPCALHLLFAAFLLSSVAFYMPCAVSQ